LLIFSDVDGTLLGEDGKYALKAPAASELERRHQVVLASSRDVSELVEVLTQVGLQGDLIAEDGAVVVDRGRIELLGLSRDVIKQRLRDALSAEEHDALLAAEPSAAQGRLGSILVPAPLATTERQAQLVTAGLSLVPGGRWATITSGADKGEAARVLAARWGVTRWAAIGNAPNDATLLGGAWRSFVIRNPEGHDPVLSRIPGAVLLTAHGPDGWLEMLDDLDRPPGDAPEKESHDDESDVDHHHPDDSGS
jgi:hydroxymethylpyrimidine pyrophosphatase-like HAD family hydrolase